MPKAVKDNSVVHVKLDRPTHARKEILKLAIDMTKMLYSYNEAASLRQNKLKLINKLRTISTDIKKLQKSVENSDLPKVPDFGIGDSRGTFEVKDTVAENVPDEVEALAAELRDIEKKLKGL